VTPHAVRFTVLGAAQPKGSTRSWGFIRKDKTTGEPLMKHGKPVIGTVTTSDNTSLAGWETAVRAAAQQQCAGAFFEGAVRLAVVFFLPRPKSAPKRVTHHTTRPDLSKLLRGVEDALTGVLWSDDARVIELVARKGYATTQAHARIVVDHAEAIEEIAMEQNLFAIVDEVRA
jgi:Holliday junction resolvase RusA-like endonuclease